MVSSAPIFFEEDMPGGKRTLAVHRPILRQAWQSVWKHKRLWIFGVFAGVVNSGSVFQIVAHAFKSEALHGGLRGYLEQSVAGATTIFAYVQKITLTSPARLTITVTCILLATLLLGVLALCAQAELVGAIPALDRKKKTPSLFSRTLRELGKVLAIDLFFRVVLILLSLGATVLFAVLAHPSATVSALVNFSVMIVFIPLALLTSYLSIFSVIETIAKKKSVGASIRASAEVLFRHWLPITEMTLLLFFVNAVFSGVVLAIVLLFAVPYLLFLKASILVGSGLLWMLTITFGAILLCLIVLTLFGFATSFTYAAWYHLYERFGQTTRIASKLERIAKHLLKR